MLLESFNLYTFTLMPCVVKNRSLCINSYAVLLKTVHSVHTLMSCAVKNRSLYNTVMSCAVKNRSLYNTAMSCAVKNRSLYNTVMSCAVKIVHSVTLLCRVLLKSFTL